ncbi:hypothetical protein V6N13_115936 [Hibiscus sabdariffa]|uniref:Uncharacterized protein n=1 Tax=Hibiscus sabdariffa TaxID=183260 RepID=A0ABR2QSB5_9ROSI
MARLAFLFTVILLLFTLSHARFLTAESDHDVTPDKTLSDLPESTTTILLPSERSDFEPTKLLDFKHGDASETDSGIGSVPLTKIRFHPLIIHFPRRPMFPFRQKHDCRFHKRFRPLNPRFHQKRFISYGNDMILSHERSFDPESRGVVRQIEDRWGSFHDDGPESMQHLDHHHHHHHHHHEHEHEHDQDHDHEHGPHHHDHEDNHGHHKHHHQHGEEEESEEEHEGGFMDKFRSPEVMPYFVL